MNVVITLLLLVCSSACVNAAPGQISKRTMTRRAGDSLCDCPPGWTYLEETDSCYKFISDSLTYSAGSEKCAESGAHHARPKTETQFTFLKTLNDPDTNFWIGLNDIETENTFVWEDGSAPTWNAWLRGEPNTAYPHEDCAVTKNGGWNDINCSFSYKSICQKEANTDWSYLEETNSCYKYYSDTATFAEAQTTCSDDGGVIAMPKSQTQFDFLKLLPDRPGHVDFWIGLSDIETDKTFVWEDGAALDWNDWLAGEPSLSHPEEDCGVTKQGGWNDIYCYYTYTYFCQVRA